MGCIAIARLSVLEMLRRKEFYVVLAMVFGIALWIQLSDPGNAGAGRFAKDVIMQVIWLASFGLSAPLAARQIASDLEQKTIYVLLARPIHRWQYVFGRCLGASAAATICFTCMYVVMLAMLVIKGSGALADPGIWQSYFLQVVALVMLCSTAVFFSSFTSPAGAVAFSLILLAVMRYGGPSILHKIEAMPAVARDLAWAGFLALPHFEFFNMSQRVVHGWGALPTGIFIGILAYGAAYSVFATSFAALLFRKRWL